MTVSRAPIEIIRLKYQAVRSY
ncbi:MAG: hypothetical protein K940chlam9_01932, partial [Chlamydiae bacterium]|nr:hypothetical protein [Chlamydiota bacterium]